MNLAPHPPRLLVLTAGYGEGHNAAARAIAAAADAAHGPGTARILDAFAASSPLLTAVTRRAYIAAVNRTPALWSALYRWSDRATLPSRLIESMAAVRTVLAGAIKAFHPCALCSTYPAYATILGRMAREGNPIPPHFNVVTDSISIHSLWWQGPCEAWFVANEDTAEVMRAAGVESGSLHALGFPLPSFFLDNADRLSPPDLSTGAAPRVLHIVNSGSHRARETATRLLDQAGWEVTIAVGRDGGLRRWLERKVRGRARTATILGWTDEMPRLLMTHHAVVSKAGGATTQEALAAGCPMIVNQVLPGQEEGNWDLLRRHGIGARASGPQEIVDELHRAFTCGGRQWNRWRAAIIPLSKPNAAQDIVSRILHSAPVEPLQPAPSESLLRIPA